MLLLLPLLLLACAPLPHDSGLSAPIERLVPPCAGAALTAIALAPHGRGWVACGERLLGTADAGRSFEVDSPTPRARIARLLPEPDGGLLACGEDPERGGRLWRRARGGGWDPLLGRDDGDGLGACAQVARMPQGPIAVCGAASPGLAVGGGGSAWHLPVGWVEGSEPPHVYDLVGTANGWAALGAGLTGPPSFLASVSSAATLPLIAAVPDLGLEGELWALATPDGGGIWVAGGRDPGGDDGPFAVLLRSTDRGVTWRPAALPSGLGWLRAIAFAPDGHCGVAVGQRAARGEGGFAVVSCDAGATWAEIPAALPSLGAAAALDAGFLVGGEGGYLGRGWWPW
jgi:hypothetical protein